MPPRSPASEPAPSLRRIAAEAGVSVATVSRVLHADPRHSAATRERVLRVVRGLGYHQHPLVSALMEQVRRGRVSETRGTLALLSAHPQPRAWRNQPGAPVFQRFHDGMCARAEWRGYRLEEFALDRLGRGDRRISDVLRARGLDGLVFLPSPERLGFRTVELDWEHFSATLLGTFVPHPPLHRACSNTLQGMLLTCETLAARGHRRIGLHVTRWSDEQVGHTWLAGYRYFQSTLPASRRLPVTLAADWSQSPLEWLRIHKADAIVTVDATVPDRLRAAGVRVPEDVGVATLDWNPSLAHMGGVDQRPEQTGAAAIDLVVDAIARHERGLPEAPRTVLVDGVWRDGPSVRPAARVRAPARR